MCFVEVGDSVQGRVRNALNTRRWALREFDELRPAWDILENESLPRLVPHDELAIALAALRTMKSAAGVLFRTVGKEREVKTALKAFGLHLRMDLNITVLLSIYGDRFQVGEPSLKGVAFRSKGLLCVVQFGLGTLQLLNFAWKRCEPLQQPSVLCNLSFEVCHLSPKLTGVAVNIVKQLLGMWTVLVRSGLDKRIGQMFKCVFVTVS
jgi:hypothetical protein